MPFHIELEDPGKPEIIALLRAGEIYGASLYPVESNHFLALDALREPNVRFVVARDDDRVAIGTGALALFEGWAELKRMWVMPAARGHGVSKAILRDLESRSRTAGIFLIRLETGVKNQEALAFMIEPASRDADRLAIIAQIRTASSCRRNLIRERCVWMKVKESFAFLNHKAI